MTSIAKPSVDTQFLQTEAGEGTPSLKESSSKKPFKKRKFNKVLTLEQQRKRENFKKTLTWLCETFPNCFNLSTPKPLKQHVEVDLFLRLPESISRRSIRTVLAFYVNRKSYHKALLENQHRFNLLGEPVEEIERAHRDHARIVLKERVEAKALRQAKNQESLQLKDKKAINLPRE